MDIFGNNFLLTIAYTAKSPNQAASMAELSGCSKEEIRLVRDAAKLKRDQGEDAFVNLFSPFELVDLELKEIKYINVEVSINRLYEKRLINAAEYNKISYIIKEELQKLGLDVKIKSEKCPHYIKSTL